MANPVGPPFYRLKLLGSGKAPVEEIKQASYNEGYSQGVADAGPGAGAAGTLVYSSGVDGLNFGIDPVPDYKTLLFNGNGDGEFYAGRLVFSGDTSAYQITVAGGDTRDTPFECDSGADFCFAFDEGSSFSITFKTLYIDSTEQTMTVEVYDIDGSLVTTITATAQIINPFLTTASGLGNVIGVWSAEGLPQGAYTQGQTVMEDSLNVADDMVVDAQNLASVYDIVVGFGCFLNSVDLNSPTNDNVAIALDAVPAAITDGAVIIVAYIDPASAGGGTTLFHRSSDPGTAQVVVSTSVFRVQDTVGTTHASVSHGGVAGWYAIAVSLDAATSVYLSATRLLSGFTYGDVGESSGATWFIWENAFLRCPDQARSAVANWKIAAIAHYSATKTPAELASVINTIEPTL